METIKESQKVLSECKNVFKRLRPIFRINPFLRNTMPSKGFTKWQYEVSWVSRREKNWVHTFEIQDRHSKWKRKGANQVRWFVVSDLLQSI
jgi:hypothetical protein